MTVTLVLPDKLSRTLQAAAAEPLETAGVILASIVETSDGDIRLLADCVRWVPQEAYQTRSAYELVISSDGYVAALSEAEARGLVPIWMHTHPGVGSAPMASRYDKVVDAQLNETFRIRANSRFYATLILTPAADGFVFSGSLVDDSGSARLIDRIWEVGDSWVLRRAVDAENGVIDTLFDRNIRAFGPAIQAALNDLRIGVVGSGGTGSAVAEQLVRLGLRDLVLIDVDTLSSSNVTRVYGSTPADVGRPKVDVLADHLRRIAPSLRCKTVQAMITTEDAARQLLGRDLIFGCTDDNAGRLVLSRLATYALTPIIDMGVLLSSDVDGKLTSINGRITIVGPGSACLVCRDRIDLPRAASELKTPEERARLESEGYAPALLQAEPAVVAFTTSVAAASVAELLERLIGYGPMPRPSEILLRWHEREISTNVCAPRSGHYCDRDAGKWGRADKSPFLEQLWPA